MASGCDSLRCSEPHFGNIPLKSALLESNEEISDQNQIEKYSTKCLEIILEKNYSRKEYINVLKVFLKKKAEEPFRSLKWNKLKVNIIHYPGMDSVLEEKKCYKVSFWYNWHIWNIDCNRKYRITVSFPECTVFT